MHYELPWGYPRADMDCSSCWVYAYEASSESSDLFYLDCIAVKIPVTIAFIDTLIFESNIITKS